jgi:hypothetical protein
MFSSLGTNRRARAQQVGRTVCFGSRLMAPERRSLRGAEGPMGRAKFQACLCAREGGFSCCF